MSVDPELAASMLAYVEDSAPILAFRLDSELRVRAPNNHARRTLGGNIEGNTFSSLLPDFMETPDVASLAATPDAVTLITLGTATGMPESFGFRFFAFGDGSLLALGSPDVQEQARLQTAFLQLNQELNERTRQLHQANAQLRELDQLKTQFLGMAAHDLRRPISVITTYCEFVLNEARSKLSTEHQQFLRTSLSAATRMKQLIDGFLDLAVLESGRLQLDLMPASAADLVAGVLPTAQLIASRKQVVLLVDIAEQPDQVSADAPKLQQVLLNLIGNAVEHSLPGQRVWLTARTQPPGLAFTVRDEGAGLAPEQQARLFEAFGRGGPQKTAGERSTGLGLAIARMVVEAHGGRIWVDSQPGGGASFTFSIPATAPQTQALERHDGAI